MKLLTNERHLGFIADLNRVIYELKNKYDDRFVFEICACDDKLTVDVSRYFGRFKLHSQITFCSNGFLQYENADSVKPDIIDALDDMVSFLKRVR